MKMFWLDALKKALTIIFKVQKKNPTYISSRNLPENLI